MKKNIVVLGGGIGGMEFLTQAARKLDLNQYQLILVDKNELHVWKPMLHTFAAGSAHASEQGINYLEQAKRHHFLFQPGDIGQLDLTHKTISLKAYTNKKGQPILPQRQLSYDYLVIALGSQTNDFHTPGVKEYAYSIDDLHNALRFHDHLKADIIQAAILGKKHHVVIVGAGATGVELAGEIAYVVHQAKQYVDHDFTQYIQITVIQSGDKVLPNFKDEVAKAVGHTMQNIGIRLILSERVKAVAADHVLLASGETIPADQVAWTTGVKAPDFFETLDVARSKQDQLIINDQLQLLDYPDVFAMGDCAAIQHHPVPPTAQAVTQQAAYLSEHFSQIISHTPNIPAFAYKDYGALVSVGRFQSFGIFGHNIEVKGLMAKLAHIYLYRRHQIRILGLWRGLCAMLADKFRQQAR
ncbi:NAD(P)/FAD-dependent oxidoreductase [Neisseriaceae bacterium ESL0693]|nr:NAD(P)/FAD-dependent oxidoreductase [Neisseriaceae bacterium ESL0693]